MQKKSSKVPYIACIALLLVFIAPKMGLSDPLPDGCQCEEGYVADPSCSSGCPYEDDCCVLPSEVVPVSSTLGNILLIVVGILFFTRYTLKKDTTSD